MSIRISAKSKPWQAGIVALAGLGIAGGLLSSQRAPISAKVDPQRLQAAYGTLPLSFEPLPTSEQFVARGRGFGLQVSSRGAQLAAVHGGRVTLEVKGASHSARAVAQALLPGKSNYFLGSDPKLWRTNVPQFGQVAVGEIYPGIDLVYYGAGQQLEYDFIVKPGADAQQIRVAFPGAKSVTVDPSGDLIVAAAEGQLRQHRPTIYQQIGGRRVDVGGGFRVAKNREVSFHLGSYDQTQDLVIDPVLNYSTFLGGGAREEGNEVKVDADGNAYVSGVTLSGNYPVAGQVQGFGGTADAFVTKFNPDGQTVVYSTYFGGSGAENVDGGGSTFGSLALDEARNAYVVGYTESLNLPLVAPIQVDNAGAGDAFVLKLNAAGNGIIYSTYLGGRFQDFAMGVAVDGGTNAYVVGSTSSPDFNIFNAFDATFNGGAFDGFLTRINAAGSGMVYSTYFGGTDDDRSTSVALDPVGNAYVTGRTLSPDYPTTAGVVQASRSGSSDAFVTKFDAVASTILYSTFLGGTGENTGTSVAVDTGGNAYVTGFTTSTDFPVTAGAFDGSWNGGVSDGFLTKLNSTATTRTYSTYLGGGGEDVATRVAVSVPGQNVFLAYVTGFTNSANFPVRNALRTSLVGGFDSFITKFNVDATQVEYSTYFGGLADDRGNSIVADGLGNAVLLGTTLSADLPTLRARFGSNSGGADCFVARLISPPAAPGPLTATVISSSQINLAWVDNSDNETGFEIEQRNPGQGFVVVGSTGPNILALSITGLTQNTTYDFRVRAVNSVGASPYSNAVTATTLPVPPAAPTNLAVTALSQSELRVTWIDASNNEANFRLEVSTDGLTFVLLADVSAVAGTGSTVTFNHTGLPTFSTRHYRVRAENLGGNSTFAGPVSGTTLDNPPSAPSGLTATAISNRRIDLAWTRTSSNETGFQIERRIAPAPFALIATTGPAVSTFSDTGLLGNTTYEYRVRAINSGGPSGYTNTASATTLPNPPNDPDNLSVTALSSSSLRLTWNDNATDEIGYKVERSVNGGLTFSEIGATAAAAGTGTFDDTGLMPSTTYHYRVRGFNGGGNSGYSNVASGTTLPSPPAPASNLRVTTLTQESLRLDWRDNSNTEDGFIVRRSLDGVNFTDVATTVADQIRFVDTILQPDTVYFYRIVAFNAGGNSAPSNVASGRTLPLPPTGPNQLQAFLVTTPVLGADLSWNDRSNNEDGFKIERSTDGGVTFTEVARTAADVDGFLDDTVQPDTVYRYRVRAFNAGGDSAFSNTVSITTVPTAPSNLSASAVSSTEIRLFWSDNSATENQFRVERRQGMGSFQAVATLASPITTYLDANLTGNTSYTYRVFAVSNAGDSQPSNLATISTLPNPPNAPSNTRVTGLSQTSLRVEWDDNSTDETGFRVERSLDGVTFVEINAVGAGVTQYDDTNLLTNTTYHYRIRAVNAGGFSGYSPVGSGTTFPTAPGAPSNLTATVLSESSVQLNWRDNSTNESGFKVERSDNNGATFSVIATTGAGILTFTDGSLGANGQHRYRVRATNAGGDSSASNTVSILTFPVAPTDPQATAQGSGAVRVSWAYPNGATAGGFVIERRLASDPVSSFAQRASVAFNLQGGRQSFDDTGLLPNVTFVYRIRATNASGNSAPSGEVSATTQVALFRVSLASSSVKRGKAVRGTVELNGLAPGGGVVVSVASDSGAAIINPGSVGIGGGAQTGSFIVKTRNFRGGATTVTITATLNGASRSTTLTIR